jgi:hypothetical protein
MDLTFGEIDHGQDNVKKSRSGIRGGVKGKEGYSWQKR